jgi:NAD(P)-dependent dehydrogenase (short-subunit alcohol dehydrogenase family)
MTSLEGQHFVVTGASGELGAAVAARLLARGAVCHLPVRAGARLGPELARARVAAGVELTEEASVTAFYRDLPDLWASLHCAGAFAFTPLESASAPDLERLWAINARAAFLCAREAARRLRALGRGGRLVNVVARQALEPRRGAGMVPYTMSKTALAAMTVAMAEELAPERILVNALAPATLDTPANRAAMPAADPKLWVTLDEATEALLFLASPDCAASGALVPLYGRA